MSCTVEGNEPAGCQVRKRQCLLRCSAEIGILGSAHDHGRYAQDADPAAPILSGAVAKPCRPGGGSSTQHIFDRPGSTRFVEARTGILVDELSCLATAGLRIRGNPLRHLLPLVVGHRLGTRWRTAEKNQPGEPRQIRRPVLGAPGEGQGHLGAHAMSGEIPSFSGIGGRNAGGHIIRHRIHRVARDVSRISEPR